MFSKSMKDNKFWATLVVVGVITFIFGVVCNIKIPDEANNSMLMGMFTGLGTAFIGIGIIKLVHNRRTSSVKLRQEEIDLNDERNVQILRIAHSVSNCASIVLFSIMAFVFVWLNYKIPAFISIGALYVQLITFSIAYKYFSSKM